MSNPNIVIIDPRNINHYKNYVLNNGWRWLFMGVNSRLRENIINILGKENRYCYAHELQNVSVEQKEIYLDWIAAVGKRQNNNFWWATNIAYKTPYMTDIFLNYCFLKLIQRWITQMINKMIVIIENPWLIKACALNFKNENILVEENAQYFRKKLLKKHIIVYLRALLFLFRAIRIWCINKFYNFKYSPQIKNILKNRIDVLICTWIENRSFKDKGTIFSDPYTGDLKGYYSKAGLNCLITTLPILPLHFLGKIYRCKEIIPSIYFAKLIDIFRTFLIGIFSKFSNKVPECNGFNLQPLFEGERIDEKGKIYYPVFHYLTSLNIFKQHYYSCKALIYPFEYQPWDKMMAMAIKHAKCKCKVVGYQHGTVSPFNLNYFLGKGEGDTAPQPDIIVSNGEYWKNVLEKSGFISPIKNGGSLRFKVPKSESAKTEILPISEERKRKILVVLSTSLVYSLDLIYYLLRCSINDREFLLKPHPDLPEQIIRRHIKNLPDNFRFVGGSMDEWLGQVGWAIHIGSTAAIECMMKGVTVFKYLPERIDLDPLLGMDLKQIVITDQDILEFRSFEDFEMPDNKLIAEPFNEETWKGILE